MSMSHHPQNLAVPKATAYLLPIDVQVRPSLQALPTLPSGMGLKALRRAAEYLVTSRNYSDRTSDGLAEGDAAHILLRLSREIFDDYTITSAYQASVRRGFSRKTLLRAFGAA